MHTHKEPHQEAHQDVHVHATCTHGTSDKGDNLSIKYVNKLIHEQIKSYVDPDTKDPLDYDEVNLMKRFTEFILTYGN